MFQGTLIFCRTLINDHQILAEATVLHVIYMLTTSIFTPFFCLFTTVCHFFQETQRIFKFQPLVLGIQFGSQKGCEIAASRDPRGGPNKRQQPAGGSLGGEAVWQQDCDLWCRHGMAWAARSPWRTLKDMDKT